MRDAGGSQSVPNLRLLVHHDGAAGVPGRDRIVVAGAGPTAEAHDIDDGPVGDPEHIPAIFPIAGLLGGVAQHLLVGAGGARGQQNMAAERNLRLRNIRHRRVPNAGVDIRRHVDRRQAGGGA